MMDLLTIACDRDLYLMDTQARSIQKFVAPCTHWIFVNKTQKSRQEWTDLLNPYYTNHKLNFVFIDDIIDGMDGYNTQQYLKLTAVDIIQNDFVIIDSKNIFVRVTSLDEWTHEGSGVYGYFPDDYTGSDDLIDNAVLTARNYYSDYYGFSRIQKFFTICTPFVARKSIMSEVSTLIKNDNVFRHTDLSWHADFMLYSMIGEKYGVLIHEPERLHDDLNIKSIFYHGITWNNSTCVDGINRIKQNENYACIGLHRTWIDNVNNESRMEMRDFLDSLDILRDGLRAVLEKGNTHAT